MRHDTQRIFLGWDRPILGSAAEWIVNHFADGNEVDLASYGCVLPTARAGQFMLGALMDRCEAYGYALAPPEFFTPGHVVSRLAPPPRPPAHAAIRTLAWVDALRSMADRLGPLVSHPPSEHEWNAWSAIAKVCADTSASLAQGGLLADDVLERARKIPGWHDDARWEVFRCVQARYRELLTTWGVVDLDIWGAEARLIEGALRNMPLILVGVADMPPAVAGVLRIAPGRNISLIGAPESESDAFDDLGNVCTSAWADRSLHVPEDMLTVVDQPKDAADQVLVMLAELNGRYSPDDISVIATDRGIVAAIDRAGIASGAVRFRAPPGRTLAASAPGVLLNLAACFARTGQVRDAAAILKHVHVGDWIERTTGEDCTRLFTRIDRYLMRQIPGKLCDAPAAEPRNGQFHLETLKDLLSALMGDLISEADSVRAIVEWSSPILHMLKTVYAELPYNRKDPGSLETAQACQHVLDVLQAIRRMPANACRVRSFEAIACVLDSVRDIPLASPPDHEAVEMLGWIEAPCEEAPVVILAGMNEGLLSRGDSSDSILPESLRTTLGLHDSRHRLARDAYSLMFLLSSRPITRFITIRNNDTGDPWILSRLLLQPEDDNVLAGRIDRFCRGGRPHTRVVSPVRDRDRPPFSVLTVPTERLQPVMSIAVTDFQRYLASPYAFMVERVLRTEEIERDVRELRPTEFGALVHDAVSLLAEPPWSTEERATHLAAGMCDRLSMIARQRYGTNPSVAVRAQVRIAMRRLQAFAEIQANRVREGWEVISAEWSPSPGAANIVVDNEPMLLRGRIDRIDRHCVNGVYAILDYKTGDTPITPQKAHQHTVRGWTNLQLPLYRYLARPITGNADIVLGYIQIPRRAHDTRFEYAGWSAAELADADAVAADVIRRIRRQEFIDRGDPNRLYGRLAWICGGGVLPDESTENDFDDEEDSP